MFPRLTDAQVQRIVHVGQVRRVPAGEVLFSPGDQNSAFHVVITGAIEVVHPIDGRHEPIVVHGPSQFTGEINMLSARRNLVLGQVIEDSEIVVVDRERLRVLVQRDAELSEILMRAFILRRMALISRGRGDLVPRSGAPAGTHRRSR